MLATRAGDCANLNRLARYLVRYSEMELLLDGYGDYDQIAIYVGADWAGCMRARQSTNEGMVTLGNTCQKVVELHTIHSCFAFRTIRSICCCERCTGAHRHQDSDTRSRMECRRRHQDSHRRIRECLADEKCAEFRTLKLDTYGFSKRYRRIILSSKRPGVH